MKNCRFTFSGKLPIDKAGACCEPLNGRLEKDDNNIGPFHLFETDEAVYRQKLDKGRIGVDETRTSTRSCHWISGSLRTKRTRVN